MYRFSQISGIAVVAGLCLCSAAAANMADSFDINRYSTAGEGRFKTFHIDQIRSLASALEAGVLSQETELLIAETPAGRLALIKDQMAFHHIAQGSAIDPVTEQPKDWIATF
jgi:hypothetical protein